MKKRKRITKAQLSATDLEEFKAFLGPLAADYTDGELRQLRREMHAMAEILLDLFIAKQQKEEPPTIEF
jgi:hypothetical protein